MTFEDMTIYGDGSQTRAFCYIADLIDGLVRLMDAGDDLTGPVNLGNPSEFTIAELAEKVMALTGSKAKFEKNLVFLLIRNQRLQRPNDLRTYLPTLRISRQHPFGELPFRCVADAGNDKDFLARPY